MRITEESSLLKYFSQIPNVIYEIDLKANQIAVYGAIKRAAGDNGGCIKSLASLAKAAGVHPDTLREIKKSLSQVNPILKKPLIKISERWSEQGDQDTDLITIVDIWEENFKYFMVVGKTGGGSPEKPEEGGRKNHTLRRTLEEEPIKKQQQQGAAAPNPAVAASFHECLKKIDIPESEKIKISKKYDIATVEHAIAYATHPLTEIKTTLIQTIKWACDVKPKLPESKEDLEKQNKEVAKKMEATLSLPSTVRFEALNKYVEIGYTIGQNVPVVIEYGISAFKEIVRKALEDHGVKFKPQT